MTKKLEYLSPETEIWPVQLEGPLCASGDAEALDDFELLGIDDITWDVL